MKSRITATFRIGDGSARTVVGREAETIIALVKAGSIGITSLEAFKAGWAVRLGAYVHDLRRMGVPIATTREPHEGGNHARYILTGHVTLMAPDGSDASPLQVAA